MQTSAIERPTPPDQGEAEVHEVTAAVDIWSSITTVYVGGLRQPSAALGRRVMVLVADERLAAQIEAVCAGSPAAVVVRISLNRAADEVAGVVADAVARHPIAVPVALSGGSSVMDLVRLPPLAAADPALTGSAQVRTDRSLVGR